MLFADLVADDVVIELARREDEPAHALVDDGVVDHRLEAAFGQLLQPC